MASNQRFELQQEGLVPTIIDSVKSVHEDFYGPLLENIVVCGGNTLFRGFKERLSREIQRESDCFIEPKIQFIDDVNTLFNSMDEFTLQDSFYDSVLKRKSYNEIGIQNAVDLF